MFFHRQNPPLASAFVAATLLAVVCAGAQVARAETVAENLSTTTQAAILVESTSVFGQTFATGANGGTLSSVTLPLSAETGAPSVTLSLHPYSITSFPAAVAVVNTVAVSSVGSYTFAPQTTVSLLPNTAYWLVARTTTGTALWEYTLNQTINGTGSLPAAVTAARSDDNGATFSAVYALADGPQKFAVIIAPAVVPESGSATLLVLAVCAGMARRRGLKRREKPVG